MSRSLWPYKVVGLARQGKEHPRPIRLDQSKRHSWETTASFFVYFLTSGHSLNGNLYVTRQPPKCFFFQFFFLSSSSFKFIYVPAYLRLDVKRAEQHRSSKIQEEFSLSRLVSLDTCVVHRVLRASTWPARFIFFSLVGQLLLRLLVLHFLHKKSSSSSSSLLTSSSYTHIDCLFCIFSSFGFLYQTKKTKKRETSYFRRRNRSLFQEKKTSGAEKK